MFVKIFDIYLKLYYESKLTKYFKISINLIVKTLNSISNNSIVLYNKNMEMYLSFFIINLIVDFSIIILINYFSKLYNSKIEIVKAIIISLLPSIIFIIFSLKIYQFLLLKIIVNIFVSMLITDNFRVTKILYLYGLLILLMFSIYGFVGFFIEFIKIAFFTYFGIKIGILYDFIVVFALFLYIFALIILFGNMFKKQNIQSFLYNVSFYLFEKHIEITGLLDSGNALYDTKSGKAVIIVSLKAIKKYLDEEIYENLLFNNYKYDEVECVSVGGNKFKIPIIDIGEVSIKNSSEELKVCKCVIGLTNEKFAENENYQCLLHREFL